MALARIEAVGVLLPGLAALIGQRHSRYPMASRVIVRCRL
jgi:hypothetical protein